MEKNKMCITCKIFFLTRNKIISRKLSLFMNNDKNKKLSSLLDDKNEKLSFFLDDKEKSCHIGGR